MKIRRLNESVITTENMDKLDSLVTEMTYGDSEEYYDSLFSQYGVFDVANTYPDLYSAFEDMDETTFKKCYIKVTNDYIKWKLEQDNLLQDTLTILKDWEAIDFSSCAETQLYQTVSFIRRSLISDLEEIERVLQF